MVIAYLEVIAYFGKKNTARTAIIILVYKMKGVLKEISCLWGLSKQMSGINPVGENWSMFRIRIGFTSDMLNFRCI